MASAQRQRGKRARSADASSSNTSASSSRKSLAWKDFKAKEGQALSSAAKQKVPVLKPKASTAKRFRSPVVPTRSTGMRLMLSPRLSFPSTTLVCSPASREQRSNLEHVCYPASMVQRSNLEHARNLEHYGMILVLFDTPSGFAIFTMLEEDLKLLDALQNTWVNFGKDYRVEDFVCLSEFREFKDKSSAINHDTGASWDLTEMIMRWRCPGQKMAAGKPEYKGIIERSLVRGVPCLFDEIAMEVMWGLKNLMHFLVPQEKMKLRDEDRLSKSQGLKMLLNRYGFDVKPEMVNDRIILMACLLLDCEYCDVKNSKPLRLAGEHLKDVSGINSEDWDLMKLVTALKIICYPAERTIADEAMFTQDEVLKFVRDAHKYEALINKGICLNVYNEMVEARTYIRRTRKTLEPLLPKIEQSA